MRLSAKYGLGVGVAALIAASAFSSLIYGNVHAILRDQAIKTQQTAAHNLLTEIDDTLIYARRDMNILAGDEYLKTFVASPSYRSKYHRALLENELRERSRFTGPWDDAMVMDRNGRYLLTTRPHDKDSDISSDPATALAFQAAMTGKIYTSDLVLSHHDSQPTLIFAAPIRAPEENEQSTGSNSGEIVGVVITHFHWPLIENIVQRKLPDSAVYLLSRSGKVIAKNALAQGMLGDVISTDDSPVPVGNAAAGDTVRSFYYGGQMGHTVNILRVGADWVRNGWGVMIEQPRSVIFAPAGRMALHAALAVIAVLVVLAIFMSLLGYRLMLPLTRLTRVIEDVGQGDLQRRIEYRSNDEVGQLASSFNGMVERIEQSRSELVAAKNRIQGIVDTVPGILYTSIPPDMRTVFVSPAVDTLLGYGVGEFLADAKLRQKIVLEDDRYDVLAEIDAAMEECAEFIITYRVRHKDGSTIRWFEDRGRWELDENGRAVALHGVMTDITERKNHEDQLARTTRALDILHNQDLLLTRATSEDELVQGVCGNIADRRVYPFVWVGLIDSERPDQLRVAAHAGVDTPLIARLVATEMDINSSACFPCRAIRDKRHCIIQRNIATTLPVEDPLEGTAGEYAAVISLPLIAEYGALGSLNIYSTHGNIFDSSELYLLKELADNLAYGIAAQRTRTLHNEAREQLTHQAYHDALTGLPNRAMFLQSLHQSVAHAERIGEVLAVLFVDLDEFKLVNDTLGHAAGDELLRQVGERIAAGVRASDMVARQGGDEFIVLLTGFGIHSPLSGEQDDEEREMLNPGNQAQRLVERLQQPYFIDGQQSYVGASIGIAVYPHDAVDADMLLRYADSAMYRAKELGRGSYAFYSADLTERQHKRMSLANRLHQALEKEQFMLHYQPIVELATGELAGVEALIRWQTDDGKLIAPGDFLTVAEDTGLIIPIGEWVLREACRQIKVWQGEGIQLPVAVNLSARQLWHGEIADSIVDIINEAGVSSDLFELEITESAMSRDPQHMEMAFQRFHENGFKISLDDFGTGYSSLSRLKVLPITTLKIDRSFVDGVPEVDDDVAIVDATMQMAHSLGLRSLAEGISNSAQWEWLRQRGCRYGQGFYFSKPVPAAEITLMAIKGMRWELQESFDQISAPDGQVLLQNRIGYEEA